MTRFYLAACVLLFSLHAAAQQRGFGEKIEVKLVEIDVIVTDRDRQRVYGLTADDFEVFEGRSRKEITNFTEYRSAATGSTAVTPEPRTLLVLIDSLPRTGIVRSRFFESLEALVTKIAVDRDRVGVVFWEPALQRATTVLEPSSDVSAISRAIRRVGGTLTTDGAAPDDSKEVAKFFEAAKGSGSLIDVEGEKATSERFAGDIELFRFRRKSSAMKRLVSLLAAAPGKKSVLYVSQSFALPTESGARLSAVSMVGDLAKIANAGGVTFYAVRPVIPDADDGGQVELARQLDGLGRLTEPTGGLLDFGARSVETLGAKMAEDFDSYYSIAYRARSDGRDLERRIIVKPKNREHRVRARQSFVEKSNETRARDTLMARLFTEQGGDDLSFEVEEGAPRRTGGDRWLLPITLRIPVDQLQFVDEVAQVKILIVAANGIAEVTTVNEDDLRIVRGKHDVDGVVKYSVQILADRRGSEVSIGVFDRRTGLVGVRTIDIRGRF